ncbi:MAG: hypothetical protein ACOYVG_08020 [Bacteroidota bacterium]
MKRKQPQTIQQIITAFECYALGDIKHNSSKPIAAFILSMCFIDNLAFFRYSDNDVAKKDRPDLFIDNYMKEYGGFGFYKLARHSVVHFYTSEGRFDIDNKGFETSPHEKIDNVYYINTDVLILCLEKAFEKFKGELLTVGSPANINALDRSTTHPVLVDTEVQRMSLSAQKK